MKSKCFGNVSSSTFHGLVTGDRTKSERQYLFSGNGLVTKERFMLIPNEALYCGALVALLIGIYVMRSRVQDLAAKLIKKHTPRCVTLISSQAGERHYYPFSTVRNAAADALRRKAIGETISCIVADGEKVWDASENDKQSLVELAK